MPFVSAGPDAVTTATRPDRQKSAPPAVVSRGPEKPDKDTEEARPMERALAKDALS